jgi:hypothetical protein
MTVKLVSGRAGGVTPPISEDREDKVASRSGIVVDGKLMLSDDKDERVASRSGTVVAGSSTTEVVPSMTVKEVDV